jgi:hypothetical protein
MNAWNLLGVILGLPMLLAAGMSFDAVNHGPIHWAHALFALTNAALLPACLIGLLARQPRVGMIACGCSLLGWLAIYASCSAQAACH